ncbi:hypothetical protein [Aureivirga marina]|uniref:hypothetical protein n=1 Tax=Aureivirga marina TaxID=1182451 RepID=UPI0018CB1295|nr:hypothetical protein [Aureivirga marina]
MNPKEQAPRKGEIHDLYKDMPRNIINSYIRDAMEEANPTKSWNELKWRKTLTPKEYKLFKSYFE